jgi:excinuclease UvrABC nuclease subunit
MNTCAGWCRPDSVTEEEYDQALEQAVLILEGRTDDLLEELNAQMESAADELHFELAASLRDRIYAIQDLSNKQRVISTVFADTDVLGFARSAPSCFAVLHYRNGNLTGKDVDLIEEPLEEDGEAVSSYLRQYYGSRSAWPKTILVPADLEDREDLEAFLTQLSGHKVALEFPQRGERVRLVETASMNAKEEVLRRRAKRLIDRIPNAWNESVVSFTNIAYKASAAINRIAGQRNRLKCAEAYSDRIKECLNKLANSDSKSSLKADSVKLSSEQKESLLKIVVDITGETPKWYQKELDEKLK